MSVTFPRAVTRMLHVPIQPGVLHAHVKLGIKATDLHVPVRTEIPTATFVCLVVFYSSSGFIIRYIDVALYYLCSVLKIL